MTRHPVVATLAFFGAAALASLAIVAALVVFVGPAGFSMN